MMKKITKISTISLLVFALTFGIYFIFFAGKGKDFHEFKHEILQEIQEQIKFADSKEEADDFTNIFQNLDKIENEDDFYAALEDLGSEHLYENIDFDTEKTEILHQLQKEISLLEDADFANTIKASFETLEHTENENTFFEKLDTIYTTLDDFYEKNGIELDVKVFDTVGKNEDDVLRNFETEVVDDMQNSGSLFLEEVPSQTDENSANAPQKQ